MLRKNTNCFLKSTDVKLSYVTSFVDLSLLERKIRPFEYIQPSYWYAHFWHIPAPADILAFPKEIWEICSGEQPFYIMPHVLKDISTTRIFLEKLALTTFEEVHKDQLWQFLAHLRVRKKSFRFRAAEKDYFFHILPETRFLL